MINSKTRNCLNLEPRLKSSCDLLYYSLISDYSNYSELEEAIGWWSNDPEKLNDVWWTLNYNSVKLDPERKLRAVVEQLLDTLADVRNRISDP